MRYIITESQFKKVRPTITDLMVSYLNRILKNDRTSDSEFIVIYYDNVPIYEDAVILEYGFEDGRLYIEKDFLDKFSSMFPLNKKESAKFISDWFSKEFEVDVKDSFYLFPF